MSWLWVVGAVWVLLGVLIGVLIGRGVRLADLRQAESDRADAPNVVIDPAPTPTPVRNVPGRPPRHRPNASRHPRGSTL
ncbi:hypothetical protein [Blastococcus sp. PRF04-17]|uniref:hypothetical protein n=1 Tax=Blastococcus sp. PRF04-17 TaxID=2933797 RepID=UPI001FF284B8|nr:hypothetical protein [Blastococcus sp. PRF04-17]UOY00215.1 hypothetical protein MVA48_14515 [Blastococcus sp. PRF04-17]